MRGRSKKRAPTESHNHGISKPRIKKTFKCCKCHKKGHLKKDCWHLNKKNSNPKGNVANTLDDGDAMVSQAITTIRRRFIDVWRLDSATILHMTS